MADYHVSHFALKINGARAPRELSDLLLDCTVENSLHLPDACTLRFEDNEFHWLDSDLLSEGRSIEVEGGQERGAMTPLFHGEIVSLEMDMAAHGVTTAVVRCFDRSHRLHRGRLSRSFVQMKDSDIVHKIGGQLGFKVHAEQTNETHDWILQNNQTNWEFLQERAAYNGFRLYCRGERDLYFHKVKNEGDGTVKLVWGDDLRSFRPRRSAAGQVDEVMVRGWDPMQKQKIIGVCKKPSGIPQVGDRRDGGEVAKKAFGAAKMVVVDRPIHTQREADDLARSVCDEIAGAFLQADGLCYGRPDLRPGLMVEIDNIGKRFSGKYYLTSTTHVYTPAEGYATTFGVDGKSPSTLLAMLGKGNGSPSGMRLGGNIVVGVVVDNKDPEGQARVKVKYPWLTEEHSSFWARQSSQMAGKGRGMYNIPEIGDEVLVAFEHGDVRRPYLLGQLWNGKDGMPSISGNAMHGPGSETNRRGFHSRIGHRIMLDDTGGKGNVTVHTCGGHIITADDAAKKVSITTTGGHSLVLDDAGQMIKARSTSGHSITMSDAANSITIQDNAGDMVHMSQGMVTLSAIIMMNLAAPMINIAGEVAVNIAGLATNMVAGATCNLVGGAAITASSPGIIQISGEGAVSIQSETEVGVEGGTAVDVSADLVAVNT